MSWGVGDECAFTSQSRKILEKKMSAPSMPHCSKCCKKQKIKLNLCLHEVHSLGIKLYKRTRSGKCEFKVGYKVQYS